MKCEFERHNEYVVCRWCGFRLRTESEPGKLSKECKITDRSMEYPSLGKAVGNAIGAVVEYVQSGIKTNSPEEVARRMGICREWHLYDAAQNRWKRCSCFLSLKVNLESGT